MKPDTQKMIIDLCREIDQIASKMYLSLAKRSVSPALAEFWENMSREELEHVDFWDIVEQMTDNDMIPPLFEDPSRIQEELGITYQKVQALFEKSNSIQNDREAFVLAFSLENHLLHTAFETFFRFLKYIPDLPSPIGHYENHINQFLEMMREVSLDSPELEFWANTILDLWKRNNQLISQSFIDPLTGAYNRRGFENLVTTLSALDYRNKHSVAFLMIDVDDFKKVNDTHGQQVGDQVLREVTTRLQSRLRNSDIIGRYGGEEFLLFLSDVNEKTAVNLAGEIQRMFEAKPCSGQVKVTVSIGVAAGKLKEPVPSYVQRMIQIADNRLYMAKGTGKNRVMSQSVDGNALQDPLN